MNPKRFYNEMMPAKYGASYEKGRWGRTPLKRAQYAMMERVMRDTVLPFMGIVNRVLEIGPGPGTWTKVLQEQNPGAQYTLVDISSVMLAQAKDGLDGSVEFIESDWTSFQAGHQYDFFFSSRALEYVTDQREAIARVAHALKPGGRGVIVTKTPKPLFDFLRGRNAALHQGQIAPHSLVELLHAQGLTVRAVRLVTATVPGIGSAPLNRFAFYFLSRLPLIPLFSESYAVFFQKP